MLRKMGFPACDHLLKRPSADFLKFGAGPAKWADANRALHVCLRLGRVEASEALTYSMHSMRHLLPTAGRQLGLDPEVVNLMGGWAGMFPMQAHYDSVSCAAELRPKLFIVQNVIKGWSLVGKGTMPIDPVVKYLDVALVPTVAKAAVAPDDLCVPSMFSGKFADFAMANSKDFVFTSGVRQVFHSARRIVHIFFTGQKSICGQISVYSEHEQLVDVTLEDDAYGISFSDPSFGFCRLCYGPCLKQVGLGAQSISIPGVSSSASLSEGSSASDSS